jgi:hypothetical protein
VLHVDHEQRGAPGFDAVEFVDTGGLGGDQFLVVDMGARYQMRREFDTPGALWYDSRTTHAPTGT